MNNAPETIRLTREESGNAAAHACVPHQVDLKYRKNKRYIRPTLYSPEVKSIIVQLKRLRRLISRNRLASVQR